MEHQKLTETISVRADPEMVATIKSIAEASGVSYGEWARMVLERAIREEHSRWLALADTFGQKAK